MALSWTTWRHSVQVILKLNSSNNQQQQHRTTIQFPFLARVITNVYIGTILLLDYIANADDVGTPYELQYDESLQSQLLQH